MSLEDFYVLLAHRPQSQCQHRQKTVAAPAITGSIPELQTRRYNDLRNGNPEWEEWECTPADAGRPEKDLLGMCPEGKQHLDEEATKERDRKMSAPAAGLMPKSYVRSY